MMYEDESRSFRPELRGWSDDILPFYKAIAHELPNPCRVVEVGSAYGRSAIFLASVLLELGHGTQSEIYMVDAWGGGWFSECLPSLATFATPRELELLRPIRATSNKARAMFWAHELDMVFIDGDHSRIGCASDLETWFPAVKMAGIFAGHDYDPGAHPGVVEAVDAFLSQTGRTLQMPTRSVWRFR